MPQLVKPALLAALALVLAGCGRTTVHPDVPGGDAGHGRSLVEYYGCGACHVISGVTPKGRVGPSLVGFGGDHEIAGTLPNTLANLMRWIERPQQILPKTDMPDLGIGKNGARDIAAYLYAH